MNPRPEPITILVADDERTVRALIRCTLQNAGHSVITAACATEALQLYEDHQSAIQMLVTDVLMPGISGVELADHLLRSRPELPVLYVSGDCGAYQSVMRGYNFLAKPFAPADLLARVHNMLETSSRDPVHAVV